MADRSPALHGLTRDPVPRTGRLSVIAVLLWLCSSFTGCGSGPSAEDANRSMTEFRLADSMYRENAQANRPEAIEHLRRALELDPTNARAHLLFGYLALLDQDF